MNGLRCPHCGHAVALTLTEDKDVAVKTPSLILTPPTPKKKAKSCACGHDAHDGPCGHGRGSLFGGCPCPGQHSRRRTPRSEAPAAAAGNGATLVAGELRLLRAIAQHGACSSEHLTILCGYKKSSRDTYLGKLHGRGLVLRGPEMRWSVTSAGQSAAGRFDELPAGDKLRAYYAETLPEGESTILTFVASRHPHVVTRDLISEATGYKKSSRDTYIGKLFTRRLLEKTAVGVRASDLLFDDPTELPRARAAREINP